MPYEGENQYSWISRVVKYSITNNENTVLEELFGVRRYAKRHRYMNKTGHLSKMMNKNGGFSVDELLNDLSYVNISKPFISKEYYSKVRHGLIESSSSTKRHLGFHLNGLFLAEENTIKMCPICYQEDQDMYGESYIHRHHNVVGVKTCYKHECYLDSIKHKCHFTVPFLDVDKCYTPEKTRYPNHYVAKQHKSLNDAVSYLLKGKLMNINPNVIEDKTKNKLHFLGVHVRPNNENHPVLKGFLEHFGSVFLRELESDFSLDDNPIWLRRFLYNSSQNVRPGKFNPIRQVFALKYLFGSLQEFHEFNEEFEPFGKGLFPCNNPVCDHYHHEVIKSYVISDGRLFNGLKGIFTCTFCEFSYMRNYVPEEESNPFKY